MWAYNYLCKFQRSGLVVDEIGAAALAETRLGYYTPPFSLKGKTVLDLGACCGETAWYYLTQLKAEKVICVESDYSRIELLKRNRLVSGLNFEVITDRFKLEHLKIPHDFIKCDIEGSEAILLDYMGLGNDLKPCILEVHSQSLKWLFAAYGFKVLRVYDDKCCVMSNCGVKC